MAHVTGRAPPALSVVIRWMDTIRVTEDGDIEIRIMVTGEAAATDTQAAVEPFATGRPLIIDQFGIDGAVVSGLIVLATATVQSMPGILDAIRRLVDRGDVGEIEVSESGSGAGIRVVGPRAQDVDRIIEHWASGEGHGLGSSR